MGWVSDNVEDIVTELEYTDGESNPFSYKKKDTGIVRFSFAGKCFARVSFHSCEAKATSCVFFLGVRFSFASSF